MTKNEFLLKLSQNTNKEEGERLFLYYSEIIEDRLEAGEDEESIIQSFGDVDKIIQEAEATYKVKVFTEKPKISTGMKALLAVVLVFASPLLLAILLPLIIVVFAVSISLVAAVFSIIVAFLATGVAGIVSVITGIVMLFSTPLAGLIAIGSGFIAIGIGIIFAYLSFKLAKVLIKGIKSFFGFLIRKFTKNKGGAYDA